MEMYTTVNVRVEMMKKKLDGKASSWDTEATFRSWEKMKTLYSESEGENELQDVVSAKLVEVTLAGPSSNKDGAFGFVGVEEEMVVEDVVE